jgi:uncharacterized phiE125 gp8 family phage protein
VALPTLSDCKSYLRIETTDEDSLVTQLLARAQASVERVLGYALTAVSRAYTNYSAVPCWLPTQQLPLPGPFKTSGPAPTVVDRDGTTVDATTYDLDNRGCKIRGKSGVWFSNGPYTITADIGLSAHPDYATQLEAVVATAIVDLVAHLYQNRNASISSQIDEGGSSVGMGGIGRQDPLPPRVLQYIEMLPLGWVVAA